MKRGILIWVVLLSNSITRNHSKPASGELEGLLEQHELRLGGLPWEDKMAGNWNGPICKYAFLYRSNLDVWIVSHVGTEMLG